MPTMISSNHLIPRSTIRYRPSHSDVKVEEQPRIPRASLIQTRKPAMSGTRTSEVPAWMGTEKPRVHRWLRLLLPGAAIGMILAATLVVLGQLLIGWIRTSFDDVQYGRPRTFQVDAIVGHNDSAEHPSHFLALNLRGQIEVIEFPGGDATHAKIYLGPHLYGSNAALVPVKVQFVDAQHNHHPDMIVTFQGEQITFLNAQGSFHEQTAALHSFSLLDALLS